MIETNIRIVAPGPNLTLSTHVVKVSGPEVSPELLEKACNHLRSRRIPAVPSVSDSTLLVPEKLQFRDTAFEGDDWRLELKHSGDRETLSFSNADARHALLRLLERECQVGFARNREYWTLDSPRIFYQQQPFAVRDGVRAYRRFEVSGIAIEDVGVGIVMDVSTGFFSGKTLAEFFPNNASKAERKQLCEEFERISRRQEEQQGTLSYDSKTRISKCYFKEALPGTTCETTGKFRIQGVTYDSLLDYYGTKQPQIEVSPDDEVVKVSFPNLPPAFVAAKLLRVRVMNDRLPRSLKNVDKISPCDRRKLIESAWKHSGAAKHVPLEDGFWRPPESHLIRVAPRQLRFGGGADLDAPFERDCKQYKTYYKSRMRYLDEHHCLSVPPSMPRAIHVAAPRKVSDEALGRLTKDLSKRLSGWTGKNVSFLQAVRYDTFEEAIRELSSANHGVVLFVFEDELPETYFNVSYDLKQWRVKRITIRTLERKYHALFEQNNGGQQAARRNGRNGHQRTRGNPKKSWDSFVEMCALDVLQQLRCVPWTTVGKTPYDARLAIDVGKDKRHFALSLVISGNSKGEPAISIDTHVENKTDWKKETINRRILCDAIVQLFQSVKRKRGDLAWLKRVLVPRDGRKCGSELEAVDEARQKLIDADVLSGEVAFDLFDVHKDSTKGIRLWEDDEKGRVENTFEGTGVIIDRKTVVLQNTGVGTLTQGTAEPMMLTSRSDEVDLQAVADTIHNGAQHNFSSPGVAQSLPIELKRTDDELKTRYSQEIRRVY